ncbi:hypothetical protein TrLO_g13427 [Triparma laevis f. longispina]|uniref:Uncharacterized protein n=1 Tax=Triparma laevis f. longispina TaxID=1714387 RepID=A0A9W7ALS7_9STRA|nr:hypothetical protein TrLO_g13427 [Triparma laevis f. longispina]
MSSSNSSPKIISNWNDSVLMTTEEKPNTADEEDDDGGDDDDDDDDDESTNEAVTSKAGWKAKSNDSEHSTTTKKLKKTTTSSKSKLMKDKGDEKKEQGRKRKATIEEDEEVEEEEDDSDDDVEDRRKKKKEEVPKKKSVLKPKTKNDKKPGEGKEKVPPKPPTKTPIPTLPPKILKFMSKSNKKIYLLSNPKGASSLPQSAFLSWCFKTGKWLDSRLDHHPDPNYTWSSILESERIEYFTVVILDDKEVKMIERMLGGRRVEMLTDYEHLAETCNLEDGFIRAYVETGKKVEGHPFIDIDTIHAAKDLEPEGKDSEKSQKNTADDAPTEPVNNTKPVEDEIKDFSTLFKGPPLIYTGSKSDGVSLKELTKLCVNKGLGEVTTHFLGRHLKRNTGKTQYTCEHVMRDGMKCRGLVGWKIGVRKEERSREREREREK